MTREEIKIEFERISKEVAILSHSRLKKDRERAHIELPELKNRKKKLASALFRIDHQFDFAL